jgi:vacuolar-type H+-ATPase subunit H
MRSELILDIFSVETEAENIVLEARKKSREMVSLAHTEGASQVKAALQEAREARQKEIADAQAASSKKIVSLQESFISDLRDSQQDALLADGISDKMVAFLCSSPLVESKSR